MLITLVIVRKPGGILQRILRAGEFGEMIFSSVIFIFFFLPFAWLAYHSFSSRFRNAILLVASLVFYAWGEKEYFYVLMLSIALNYIIGLGFRYFDRIESGETKRPPGGGTPGDRMHANLKKSLLVLGIALNLGLLLYYKYIHFVMSNIDLIFEWLHLQPFPTTGIRAPLGISFLTFHAISYLVDSYQSRSPVQNNPTPLALYLAFFPKVLAGPILQYHSAARQLTGRVVTSEAFVAGIERFITGLAKKALIANPLASVADRIFAIPSADLTLEVAWLGILSFTLQIYFDFAGYSDMAVGLGKTFGFELPENFNYPYISQSVQEFWRRWHISLSTWFRDYLYIPLGGNRRAPGRVYFNLVLVFFLCGLWHGANWTFILWGLWYGLFLVLERTRLGAFMRSTWRPLRHLYALLVIVIGWVLFRSENIAYALAFLKAMLGFEGEASGQYYPSMFLNIEVILCLCIGVLASMPVAPAIENRATSLSKTSGVFSRALSLGYSLSYAVFLSVLFFLSCMSLAGGTLNSFIYFKF